MRIPIHPQPQSPELRFRHELKYLIQSQQLYTIRSQLPDLMQPDPHAGADGCYRIRSLYFDDYRNTAYYENANGTEPREKFRLRIYNGSAENIRLELKRKEHSMIHKRWCVLTREQAEAMVKGIPLPWDEDMDPLLKKFYILQETRLLRPKIIVEYDRIPYIYPDGNVRVTLDLNICASHCVEDFLQDSILTRPVMPLGTNLLEVKYNQLLPDFIYRSLQCRDLQRVTYSKYFYCRKYGDLL